MEFIASDPHVGGGIHRNRSPRGADRVGGRGAGGDGRDAANARRADHRRSGGRHRPTPSRRGGRNAHRHPRRGRTLLARGVHRESDRSRRDRRGRRDTVLPGRRDGPLPGGSGRTRNRPRTAPRGVRRGLRARRTGNGRRVPRNRPGARRRRLPGGGPKGATLRTLGERLSRGEAADLALYLPEPLAEKLLESDDESTIDYSLDEFLQRVSQREGVEKSDARRHARAVGSALAEAASEREIGAAKKQLPDRFGVIFEPPDGGDGEGQ